ncbi:hypothetical protein F2P81_022564 [Scophthalmus maximus]|uniref:Uncharacterized protein n=1 Tax=Scophthalmus maximus TaxID=52904 RepID=A0A6A4RUL0_SCOMX|nr:hypothetical protein F2P81_022564 [Scophthalmus maximus]
MFFDFYFSPSPPPPPLSMCIVLDFTSQSNVPVLPPWVSPQEAREVGGMGDKTSKVPIQYSDLSRVLSQQHQQRRFFNGSKKGPHRSPDGVDGVMTKSDETKRLKPKGKPSPRTEWSDPLAMRDGRAGDSAHVTIQTEWIPLYSHRLRVTVCFSSKGKKMRHLTQIDSTRPEVDASRRRCGSRTRDESR